ncbi:MAG: hypothetical protein KY475_01320 [Planctomycetes bacterium]|nr:hypothetical protein [Planctomycetota bacterium]
MIVGLYFGASLGASAARPPIWTLVGASLGAIVGAAAGILGALLPAM